jgi:DNA polymerase-3 subunit beta
MNGIFFEIGKESLIFVASDAQKLVKYERKDIKASNESSFVLPKKPANLLKGILPKEQGEVQIDFDDKNAMFTLTGYKMVCRLAEGQFPSYSAVIPTDNPNRLTIDRMDFANTLRRVSVFSNQASNLVKLQLKGNQITISAQDIDFSISAYERLNCQYDGDEMEIGFKSTFLIEILNNLTTSDILFEMSDPSRAGILKPIEKEDDNEDILMLLMPMMINA